MSSIPRSDQEFSGKRVERYYLSSIIGSGSAGTVYRGVDARLRHSPPFAIKCIKRSHDLGQVYQQMLEIANHEAVSRCKHVIDLLAHFDKDGYFFLVFPLCQTDMFEAIWRHHVYWRNDALIKEVFVDLLDGVLACHKEGVYHRDLKPGNILCNAQGTNIKIADFGLSTNHRTCRGDARGTLPYMSPECLDNSRRSYSAEAVDIWSLGVILFNMVTCQYPWDAARRSDEDYVAYVMDYDHLCHTWHISQSLAELLDEIWHPKPKKRLPISEIKEAILEMGSFYQPVDFQQTCVSPEEDAGEELRLK